MTDIIIKIFDFEYEAKKSILIKNSLFFASYLEEFDIDRYEIGEGFIYIDEDLIKDIMDYLNDVSKSFLLTNEDLYENDEINEKLLASLIYFDFFQFDKGINSVKELFNERKININIFDKYIFNENIKDIIKNYIECNTIIEEEIEELFRYNKITNLYLNFIFIKLENRTKEYIEKIKNELQVQIIYYDDYIDSIEFYKFIKSLKGIISNYDELNERINLKMVENMENINNFKEYYKIINEEYFLYRDVKYFKKIDKENKEDNYPIVVFDKDSLKVANKITNVLCWKIKSMNDVYYNIVNVDNLKLKVEILEINNETISMWNFENNYLPNLHTLRFVNCGLVDISVRNNNIPKLKNLVFINSTVCEGFIKKFNVETCIFYDCSYVFGEMGKVHTHIKMISGKTSIENLFLDIKRI